MRLNTPYVLLIAGLLATIPFAFFFGAFVFTRSVHPSRSSTLTTKPASHPSSSPQPSVPATSPLAELFINETYRYSFQYPSNLSLVRGDGDKVVSLTYTHPVGTGATTTLITFSIVTPAEEREALDDAITAIKTLPELQTRFLESANRGERLLGEGLAVPSVEPFLSKSPRKGDTPSFSGAVGIKISLFRTHVYVRLPDNHVLHVEAEEHGLQESVNSVLDSLDTLSI